MTPFDFFSSPHSVTQKQYEALRMYFLDKKTAREVAPIFGYSYRGFTTVISIFLKKLNKIPPDQLFFAKPLKGRPVSDPVNDAEQSVIGLRKKNYSVDDIKVVMDGQGLNMSEKTIYNILSNNGFSKLPRRLKVDKQTLENPCIDAPKSISLDFGRENFKSTSAGLLCFLPYIHKYGIDKLIEESLYPQTESINRLSSILSFLALKLSNVRRYTADNLWCMDRGMGLFAGLNVLPKAAWFTSYSDRVTSEMNHEFLARLHRLWTGNGLLNDTANLDFTTIPYWGNADHLENNWSGKRTKALQSMLAVLAHDPDSGIIDYGNANVLHKNESAVVLEYLDFYTLHNKQNLKYLIFDSKFTNYQNLNQLNQKEIKFITIRRKGKNMVDRLDKIPANQWKIKRIETGDNKSRNLKVFEEEVKLKDYDGLVRQISITGNGKIKPGIIITNDFELSIEKIVRKYARRWLVEKTISQQIEFFHLNHVSSSMVIKVDFDLTMSLLAFNLYRLMALDFTRYDHLTAQTIYEKFIINDGDIIIDDQSISVSLKKKRNLPLVLEKLKPFSLTNYCWLNNKKLIFDGASYS
jgi:hypothetical protein